MDWIDRLRVLRDIRSGEAALRRAAHTELLRREIGVDAIFLTAVGVRSQPHKSVSRLGYEADMADFMILDLLINDADARRVISDPSKIYSWENLPGFRESSTAAQRFMEHGFRNGVTMPLVRKSGRLIGTCNVSVNKSKFSSSAKSAMISLTPLLIDTVEQAQTRTRVGLTAREIQVLRFVRLGYTDAQIAERMTLSARTVSTHMDHARTKLGCTNRTQALLRAVELDIL